MARPREFDEHQVLEAARDAFWSGGYEGTSIQDLTAATGLGKGSLYAAFGGKRELFERVFTQHCGEMRVSVREQLDGPDEGAYERLRRFVNRIATASGPAGDGLGCLLAKTTAEIGANDVTIGELTRTAYEDLAKALTAAVEAAQRHGDVAPAADARKLGTLLLASLRGIEAMGKGGVGAAMLKRAAEATMEALPRP